jgi:hypothetical protein
MSFIGDSTEFRGKVGTTRMSQQQPEITSPALPTGPVTGPGSTRVPSKVAGTGATPGTGGEKPAQPRIPRWLESSELFLRVLLRMYIGLAICYAPWSGRILTFLPWSRVLWDENPLFVQFPMLAVYASNGAVRGVVSGLGLLNLWIAFHDAMRHRDG